MAVKGGHSVREVSNRAISDEPAVRDIAGVISPEWGRSSAFQRREDMAKWPHAKSLYGSVRIPGRVCGDGAGDHRSALSGERFRRRLLRVDQPDRGDPDC